MYFHLSDRERSYLFNKISYGPITLPCIAGLPSDFLATAGLDRDYLPRCTDSIIVDISYVMS